MKNLLIIISILAFSTFYTTSVDAQSDRDQIEVMVDGLGCPFCAYGLEKKFKEFKGIKNVKIDIETGKFTFSYPSDKEITLEQIENKVDKAGYTAVKTKVLRGDGSVESAEAEKTQLTDESIVISETFFVAGNCGMCKARIEKATKSIDGVIDADWNKEDKKLTVSFDQNQITLVDIEIAIAKSGHDTPNENADSETYDELPGCCQYDRNN